MPSCSMPSCPYARPLEQAPDLGLALAGRAVAPQRAVVDVVARTAAAHRNPARAHQLLHTVGREQLLQRLDLPLVPRPLDDGGVVGDVDDVGAEDVGDLED